VAASYVKRDLGSVWLDCMNNVRTDHICLGDTTYNNYHSRQGYEANVSQAVKHNSPLCL